MAHKLYEIRPRSIVYLFSGGKDSSLALLKTRDVVRKYAEEHKAKVYILYVLIPGNTHPLNTYASATVMYWHRKHYGFEPMFRCVDRVFQEFMAKYGLQKGPGRWCFIMFKDRVFRDVERRLPRPQLHIDGMSPRDSKHRREIITSEFQYIETKDGTQFWAWHPLINFDGDPLDELRKHPEFRPIVKLYEHFGDSMNCVVCPYKTTSKYIKHNEVEPLDIISDYVNTVMRSKHFRKVFNKMRTINLTNFMEKVAE
ncbi:MAG: hypothetical protein DRO39_09140 [Thermoprotei archaeon]|nr:MAG: hypothetical protein DRO39_09140 [Thermoprotei archaeon]